MAYGEVSQELARPVLWLKGNTVAEINLAVKFLSRLSKLDLTAFAV